MTDLDKAISAPTSVFAQPEDVMQAADLDHEQKRRVLQQWSYELRELMVATDENMEPLADAGKPADLLGRVDRLLRELDPDRGDAPAPTRQGGV